MKLILVARYPGIRHISLNPRNKILGKKAWTEELKKENDCISPLQCSKQPSFWHHPDNVDCKKDQRGHHVLVLVHHAIRKPETFINANNLLCCWCFCFGFARTGAYVILSAGVENVPCYI